MKNVKLLSHPLIADCLKHLRDKEVKIDEFRHYSNQICQILFLEAIDDIETKTVEIETPLVKTQGDKLACRIIVVPVLRAGLAMLFGALELLPKAQVGFVGMQRDEKTAQATEYYWKFPEIKPEHTVIVTDPMLATGGSLLHLLREVSPFKPKKIKVVCVIAAPEGVAAIQKEFPEVEIYTAAIDDHLNEQKYIVPGLGDYGDRYFGT
ncbi:MAG: uracil phosphoribosyltransferase [bacterium]|nr:uracil phosphoribosyltransferase [bacterium]